MLLILELLFLVAGLWALIIGKLPERIFRFLFGKGIYHLPAHKTRLFGLLLASPLPVSFTATFFLTIIFGERSTGIVLGFELVYFISVMILSIIIVRKIREPVDQTQREFIDQSTNNVESRNYSSRLLIIIGLAIVSFITAIAVITLLPGYYVS